MTAMCTAVVSVAPGDPVPLLLAGVRDEFLDREWRPPARHWPARPGLLGGRDLLAGGTWLAVDPAARRAGCVLNGRGRAAAAGTRLSRGELPLLAAAGGDPAGLDLDRFDPFHLVAVAAAGPSARLWSWDGDALTDHTLGPGLHMIVNAGLAAGPVTGDADLAQHGPVPDARRAREAAPDEPVLDEGGAAGRLMSARVAHFRPLLAAARPRPRPGPPPAAAWDGWLPLFTDAGPPPDDPAALILRHRLGDGRVWGTSSVSLLAMSATGLRYDFCAVPGDAGAWRPVPVDPGPAAG